MLSKLKKFIKWTIKKIEKLTGVLDILRKLFEAIKAIFEAFGRMVEPWL